MPKTQAATPKPTPETCDHPNPVVGVLTQAFGHYPGAIGPEGIRRTVTYSGPVIGGMGIRATHCERCGLLKLQYPDGRTEEQQLYPGPQPGLLEQLTVDDPLKSEFGRQAIVSGISLPPRPPDPPKERKKRFLGWLEWISLIGLVGVGVLFLVVATTTTLAYQTPIYELQLMQIIALDFLFISALNIIVRSIRRLVVHLRDRPTSMTASK